MHKHNIISGGRRRGGNATTDVEEVTYVRAREGGTTVFIPSRPGGVGRVTYSSRCMACVSPFPRYFEVVINWLAITIIIANQQQIQLD